jgi:hypothetical protein
VRVPGVDGRSVGTHCRGSREQKMACEPFGRDSPRGAAQTCSGCHVAVVWPLELKNARLEAPACHQSNARKRDPPGTKFGSCGPKSGAFPGRPRTKPAPAPRSLARTATGDAHGPSVVAPHPPGSLGTAAKPPGISRETPCTRRPEDPERSLKKPGVRGAMHSPSHGAGLGRILPGLMRREARHDRGGPRSISG